MGGGVSVGTRGEAPRSDRHTAAGVFSSGRGLLVIVTCQVELLLKGRCGAWEPYQRSSGEILYEDETDNVAAFSGGVCGVQHGDGVSAGGGYAAS
ncbi:hypothetical protein SAMN06295937_105711, partial [Sphingopyxis flava]